MNSPSRQRTTRSLGGLTPTGPDVIRIENILPKIERTFLSVGTTIGKYRIIEEIDRGGMAVVYKAMQLDLERVVALKVLPANVTINRRFVERFQSEAHAVAKLSHPNIVNIHEVSMEDNVYFLAMDYIPGKNLFYYLNFQKPKLVEVLEIVATLADALAYAHGQKIIHRDLKLNNVIMKENRTPVLIDFGLAKAMEGEDRGGITQTGEIVGSPAYMAPERLLGHDSDHRSDICSLGIMMYEMLTFKNPYLDPRSIHQTTMNILESNPIPPRKLVPWLQTEIEAVTLKAMHKDPDGRYQTMEEFRDDIRRYQKGEPVLARTPSLVSRGTRFLRRHWAVAVISMLVALFSLLFAVSLYVQGNKERPHWQLVFQESFARPLDTESWKTGPEGRGSAGPGSGARGSGASAGEAWSVVQGALRCRGRGLSYVRLERPLTRDILIEFDVRGIDGDLGGAGFFLYGDDPRTGYGFHLLAGPDARSGITFPEHDVLFSDIDPLAFPAGSRYHVTIRRDASAISMTVNDVVVATVKDLFPPLGRSHQKIGFFVKGGAAEFDNLRIYRRAIPQLSTPTLVADRFWERGDIEGALEEYRGLLVDYPNSEITHLVSLRIADCLIRLERWGEARQILDSIAAVPAAGPERGLSTTLYLKGTLRLVSGDVAGAQKIYGVLSRIAPDHPAAGSACAAMINLAADSLAAGRSAGALAISRALPELFPQQNWRCGMALAEMMRFCIAAGAYDTAVALGAFIDRTYPSDQAVLAQGRLLSGTAYLNKGDRLRAVEALNRCISLPPSCEAVWNAWEKLAQIYQYDHNDADARSIYNRIYDQCPRTVALPWQARLRYAEMCRRDDSSGCNLEAMLNEVAGEKNPFPWPRAQAQYYLDRITAEELKSRWETFRPDDLPYHYCFARRASWSSNLKAVRSNLLALERTLPAESWDRTRIRRVFEDLARW